MPGEGSRTVGIDLLSMEQLSIVGDLRYVCWVGISNTGDLLLSLASLSGELSYFRILVPEYQRVTSLRSVEISCNIRISLDGENKGTGNASSLDLKNIEDIHGIWDPSYSRVSSLD